jgi:predicted DsbA family dithiol-disulfide isomerase
MHIESWSDVVCPWCYIGKRRFETALAQFDGAEAVQIEYRAFELDPSPQPARTLSEAQRLAETYGRSLAAAEQMLAQVSATAAGEGLAFDFATVVGANTFRAHQLIALAADVDARSQREVKERLLAAHFEQGLDVDDLDTLVGIAGSAGLDQGQVRTALAEGRYADTVRDQEAQARRLGISGVPFFVIDRTYGVSGAQTPEVLLDALTRAAAS